MWILLKKNWLKEWFGGNDGIYRISNKQNACGFVRFVDTEFTVEVIKQSIQEQYNISTVDLFRRGHEKIFTGSIKVTFSDENELKRAIENKVKIGNQIYYIEPFINKPR